jgi:hypothetical protein
MKKLNPNDTALNYEIAKSSDDEHHFTLGVAYPANEVDIHKDFCSPEEVEKAAWGYLPRGGRVGLMHKYGSVGSGDVVESYVYRFPPVQIGDQIIEPGDWLLGVIWSDDAWAAIKSGKIKGYSIHGMTYKKQAEALPQRMAQKGRQMASAAIKAAGLSRKPWSGAASNYNDTDAYCAACLIDLNPSGAEKKQALCKLPVKEPGGAVNVNALHAAASALAGGRTKLQASTAAKAAAARKLLSLYRRAGEEPPESLTKLAGGSRGADKGS